MQTIISCSALNFVTKHLEDHDLMELTLRILPWIRQAGFDFLELYLRQGQQLDLSKLVQAVQQEGLKIYSLHYWKPLLNRDLQEGIKLLQNSLKLTAHLGAALGVLHPPTKSSGHTQLQVCQQVLEKVLPLAEELEIMLTLENLAGTGDLALLVQLLREFPSKALGITMDLKFLHAAGHTMAEYFEVLGQKIVNIHVNDYVGNLLNSEGKRQYPELGSGCVDFNHLRNLLSKYQYQGVLTLESALPPDCNQQISKARTFLAALVPSSV